MSSDCESYYTEENVLVENFTCPKADGDTTALYCCGFSDLKYCCADPNSFFPYEYGYMWWLSGEIHIPKPWKRTSSKESATSPIPVLGALMGLSIAAVVLLAFIITLCVLCYLFITTKPRGLDNGLPLRAPGSTSSPQAPGPSNSSVPPGPQGLRKHFLRGRLDCDNQPPDPERLFQRCFMATVTSVKVEGPA
ncbi:protein shisa-like-2B isoform X1 [Oreochromis aureus]|uniref:protein shisa-like-2B isoform X1 n=1 Tax=Oreochromis aureus TaxID=47969 RepID=UPI001953CC6F|nr:protein shisa-like-2B isoform X1 [Oreochromis aureus]